MSHLGDPTPNVLATLQPARGQDKHFGAPTFLASQSNQWLFVLATHCNHTEALKNPDARAQAPGL